MMFALNNTWAEVLIFYTAQSTVVHRVPLAHHL